MNTQPVQIVARLRPPLANEQADDAISVLPIPSEHPLAAARPIPFTSWVSVSSTGTGTGTTQVQNSQTAFHTAFGSDTTQQDLFDTVVAPYLPPLLKGHMLTVLAYGPTSSGKTHTMEGSASDPGIISRSVRVLFEMGEEGKESGHITSYEIHMSYLELYKDDAFDLLVPQRSHEKLPIRTNAKGETFVVGLTRVPINSFDDWKNVFRTASQNRTTGATLLNRSSSRSHAMLSIEIEVVTTPTSETHEMTYNGKINLVDLAGSENNKHTGNSLANPTRLAESAAINKSLSTLGQVVHALNTGASRIPYRDSNLTRLLSACLGGKALGKTILLCNLAPGVKFRTDVLNTLNFASRTKNIETKIVVNEREKPQPVEKERLSHVGLPARRPSIQSRRASTSFIPGPGSRIPSYGTGGSRLSGFGIGTGDRVSSLGVKGGNLGRSSGIDDTELDERISRAVEAKVEAEVQRRLAERDEMEKLLKRTQEQEQEGQTSPSVESESEVVMQLDEVREDAGDELIEEEEEREEPMDIDHGLLSARAAASGSSPMKVDSADSAESARSSGADNGEDLKTQMENLERSYKEHIAQLETQLAAASSDTPTFMPESTAANGSASWSSSSSLSSSVTSLAGGPDLQTHTPLTLDTGLIGSKAGSLDAMSLGSRKKAGRAYVQLARGYSEKNDLHTALALYRHALAFVPDNTKLKERIIDVEWAVKNGKTYVPTPKRQHNREEKPKPKPSKTYKPHHPPHSQSSKHTISDDESKENSGNLPKLNSDARGPFLSLKSSKRKRSLSQEPTPADESEYVFIPPATSGFGTDLGNINEEAEGEAEQMKVEADEFGAKVLRRSPKKRMSLRSPSVTDKRKMLGMSLASDLLPGAMGQMSGTPIQQGASMRKTSRVSELGNHFESDRKGDLDGAPTKQKRVRLG